VTVCVVDDDDIAGSGEACDTLRVTAVHAALRFGAFAVGRGGTSLNVGKEVVVTDGGLASNGAVVVLDSAEVTGATVSVADLVDLHKSVRVTGQVRSGLDALIGEKATVEGDVLAGANAALGPQALVEGRVEAVGTVTLAAGATATGGTLSGATLPPVPPMTGLSLSLSAGTTDVTVAAGQTLALAPGSYGNLRVRTGGVLALQVGRYAFATFNVDAGAQMTLDLTPVAGEADVIVDVVGALSTKDGASIRVVSSVGDARNVLFRVGGGQVQLGKNGAYVGTFVAPTGQIELADSSMLVGMLYGEKVNLKSAARVTWLPALDAFVATMVPVVPLAGIAADVDATEPPLGPDAALAEGAEVEPAPLAAAVYLPVVESFTGW